MCTLLSALGAGASLFTGIAQSRNAQAMANAQANALESNAKNSEILAHDAIERGGQEELRLRRQLSQLQGTQTANAAASGIDTSSGSALDARNASISEGEHDAAMIRFNAARERWGYLSQAGSLYNQAANTRAQGKYNANNILFGNAVNFGLGLGRTIYDYNYQRSPLTETVNDDRTKYWGSPYRELRRRLGGTA